MRIIARRIISAAVPWMGAFIAALFLILNLAQAVLLKNANTEVLFTDEDIQEATKSSGIPVE